MRTDDGYIIHKCLSGEPEAFGLLIDKYKAGIYAFIYAKLRNFHDAEDVTQNVFVKAFQRLRTLRRWDSFPGWLYRIASNLCKNFLLSQSKRPDREFIEDQYPESLEEPSIDPSRDDVIYESLNEALNSLPEAYQQVLTLYYFGGMDSVEIAKALCISPNAVRLRLTRARIKLKEEVLAMMSETFQQHRLQARFTFRVVEAIKNIKIHPMSRMTGLPWGLSATAGIIITVLSLNPYLNLSELVDVPMASELSSDAKVLKTGEFPVDVLQESDMVLLTSKQKDEMSPNLQSELFMAPQAKGGTWTKKVDMPGTRAWHSASVVNEKIYVIGGWDVGNKNTTVEEYDPARDKWTKKADIPTGRREFTTSVVNGKIYAIGGRDASGNLAPISTVEEYDPVTDKWTKKANMPTARSHLSSCAINGKIYAICGMILDNPIKYLSTLEEYDPVEDKWTKKTDTPMSGYVTSVAINGRLYAFTTNMVSGLNIVYEYDPSADKWLKKIEKPATRCWLAASVVNERIYVIGGADIVNINKAVSTIEEYDPIADKWTKKADMPTARYWHSVNAVNGKIYAIGGVTGLDANNFYIITPAVEEYNTGFTGEKVEPKGKLPTTWGDVRTASSR